LFFILSGIFTQFIRWPMIFRVTFMPFPWLVLPAAGGLAERGQVPRGGRRRLRPGPRCCRGKCGSCSG
jgi:hypothetical protein